ncbi:acyl-CoA dehydrogenase [Coniella lustricola]|uniref:Acyl-CoA dehydrogenase n=1 Tax=Coniella lustricola TaxID=2025994 RepID=A0A2T2ZUF1_9PEZI|nr:acyl-CoA dehydrogenase [Coniella lustricola]
MAAEAEAEAEAAAAAETAALANPPWGEPAWLHTLPSPYYQASHRALQAYARAYIDRHILPHALDWEAQGDCPAAAKHDWIQSGIPLASLAATIPPLYRTAAAAAAAESPLYRPASSPSLSSSSSSIAGIPLDQLDEFHHLILIDEISRFEGGVAIALANGATSIGIPPVLAHGTDAQKQRWVPGLFTRETSFCLAITEPSAGSDVAGIRTRAVKKVGADGSTCYVVTGTKKWITGAQWATHMTTAVRTDTAHRSRGPHVDSSRDGISLLVIPLASAGIEIEKIPNSGQNAGGASWVRLHEVAVPADNLIGVEGGGFKYIMANFNRERYAMAVMCNRKARTCLSTALAYAAGRETFGQPLVRRQMIRHKLVAVAREVEMHWAWLEQIAYALQQQQQQQTTSDSNSSSSSDSSIAGKIALAKVAGGRLLERAAREAQQVMGGVAYQRGGPGGGGTVEQITRDLRMMVVGGGSEEILEELAFKQEVKGAAANRGARL